MLTPLKSEIAETADLAHEARRFRTILKGFERSLELLLKDSGLNASVDQAALAGAFAKWRSNFDQSKYLADINRHDFVIFAAGLMLKELVAASPLKISESASPTTAIAIDHRLRNWPEGYAYASFCLSVATAILGELGEAEPAGAAIAETPAFWQSFRENTAENPASAVAFFDLVCGENPNWDAPDVPWLRTALNQKATPAPAEPGLGQTLR